MNKEQDKQAFFVQYWGQHVGHVYSNGFHPTYNTLRIDNNLNLDKVAHINLRRLEDITDEEARELGYDNLKDFTVSNLDPMGEFWEYGYLCLSEIDQIRSKGFLLPFRDYSIEDILKLGWAKFK